MKFLLKYGFTEEELNSFRVNVPPILIEQILNSYQLVSKNLDSLLSLGINNTKKIFMKFYDMFLMDNSNFMSIFNKYDQADLIEKLDKNIDIVEFL